MAEKNDPTAGAVATSRATPLRAASTTSRVERARVAAYPSSSAPPAAAARRGKAEVASGTASTAYGST